MYIVIVTSQGYLFTLGTDNLDHMSKLLHIYQETGSLDIRTSVVLASMDYVGAIWHVYDSPVEAMLAAESFIASMKELLN